MIVLTTHFFQINSP